MNKDYYYEFWFSQEFSPPSIVLRCLPSTSAVRQKRGRPSKNFDECIEAGKRQKTENLRKSVTTSELMFATAMKLRAEGDTASAKLLTESTSTSPTRSKRILAKWKTSEKIPFLCYLKKLFH